MYRVLRMRRVLRRCSCGKEGWSARRKREPQDALRAERPRQRWVQTSLGTQRREALAEEQGFPWKSRAYVMKRPQTPCRTSSSSLVSQPSLDGELSFFSGRNVQTRREKVVWERGEAKGQQTHTGTKGPKDKRGPPASAG